MGKVHQFRGNPAGDEPFLEDFFRDMSPALMHSFTDEQLHEIKKAFGARDKGAHEVDLRFKIPFLRRYVVLLIGRERRSRARRAADRKVHPLATSGNAVALGAFAIVAAIPLAVVAFGVKFWLGIDVISDGGGHAFVEDFRQQMVLFIKGL
jgi:hypothetical protein